MKLETKNGIAVVTSTNAKEYRALVTLSLGNFSETKQTGGASAAKKQKPTEQKKNSKFNPWKGKHKKPCVYCGVMFRNMLKHTNSAHKDELPPVVSKGNVEVSFTDHPRKEKKVDVFDAVDLSQTS